LTENGQAYVGIFNGWRRKPNFDGIRSRFGAVHGMEFATGRYPDVP
jgi:hypothetical protein